MKRLESIKFYTLLGITMLTPLPFGTVEAWSFGLFSAAVMALLLLHALSGEIRPANPLVWPMAAVVVLGLLQATIPSATASVYDTEQATRTWAVMSVYFYLCSVTLNSEERIDRAINALVLMGTLLAVEGVAQMLSAEGHIYWYRYIEGATAFGPFVNKNHFAGYMELCMPLALSAFLRHRRYIYLAAAIVMSIAVLLSASRAGIFSLFLGTAIGVMVLRGRKENAWKLLGAFAVILLLSFLGARVIGSDHTLASIGKLFDDKNQPLSYSRGSIWIAGWRVFLDNPLTGAGLGAFPVAVTRHDTASGLLRLEQTHNDYLQVLADTGIVGASILIIFIILLGRRALHRLSVHSVSGHNTGLILAILPIAIHSLFDFNIQIPALAITLLLIIAAASAEILEASQYPVKH